MVHLKCSYSIFFFFFLFSTSASGIKSIHSSAETAGKLTFFMAIKLFTVPLKSHFNPWFRSRDFRICFRFECGRQFFIIAAPWATNKKKKNSDNFFFIPLIQRNGKNLMEYFINFGRSLNVCAHKTERICCTSRKEI